MRFFSFYPNLHAGKPQLFTNKAAKILSSFFTMLFALFFSAFQFVQAQTTPPDLTSCYAGSTCKSGEFTIDRIYIASDLAGTPLTSASCSSPGATVQVYLAIVFSNNTSSDRDGIFLSGRITSGNSSTYIYNCFGGLLAKQKKSIRVDPNPFLWTCGAALTLTDGFTGWNSASGPVCLSNCSGTTKSKCRTYPSQVILTPLVANFTSSGSCPNPPTGQAVETTTFTSTTTGGVGAYTYTWNFGDGTSSGPLTTNATVTHTFATTGDKTVTLTVTDAATPQNSDGETKTNVAVGSCCTASTPPTGVTKGDDNFCSGSGTATQLELTGGSLGTGATYEWYAGVCGSGASIGSGTSISVTPTVTTTYYVRAEGTCGNTTCASVTVNVKPVLDAPSASVTHQPTCTTSGTVTVSPFDNTVTYTLTKTGYSNTANATTGVFSSVPPGTYVLTASKTGSCSKTGDNVTVDNAPTAPTKPVVEVKTAASCSSASIVLKVTSPLGSGYEYNNKGGNWQSGVEFTIQAGDGFSIKARRTGVNSDCESDAAACADETTMVTAPANTRRITDMQIELNPKTSVFAAPNPFSDKIRFSLKSAVSGKGTLELYNTLGQKVKTVYQGYVNAGQVQTIEYQVPGSQRANLLYVFTVGDQKTSGKLINR